MPGGERGQWGWARGNLGGARACKFEAMPHGAAGVGRQGLEG